MRGQWGANLRRDGSVNMSPPRQDLVCGVLRAVPNNSPVALLPTRSSIGTIMINVLNCFKKGANGGIGEPVRA